jgi:hypothetical protein
MKKIVSLLFLFQVIYIFFSCTTGKETQNVDKDENESVEVKTYTQKVISFQDKKQGDFGKVILSADTLVPNYYIEYNNAKYRIDSHLYHQRGINFSYDIFENNQVSKSNYGSFVLFFAEKLDVFQEKTSDGLYHYSIFNISKNNNLIPSKYYEIYEYDDQRPLDQDTIASLKKIKLFNLTIEKYLSKEYPFPSLNAVKEVNYLLRNGQWTSKLTDEEENLIAKHFVNYISK